MPTYEYQCEKCKQTFDCYQSMKDPVLTVCPKELCTRKKWGAGKVKRLLGTGAGLIFKGSGFYITDYRSEGYKASAKSESTAKSEASGQSKGGGDGKPGGESKASESKAGESKAGGEKKAEVKPAAPDKAKPAAKKRTD